FSDGTQVSSWAKGAVAALVEQGYVSGADGALNPQSYITRAEFAQVMDALVAAYGDQDLKDQTVEGNLILRANGTLENVTVKGDLILADGVSAASLKNVTVTDRLVVRGGTDGVSLTKSTPKKGIQLANPNGTPKVTVDGKAYVPTGLPGSGSNGGGGSSSGGNSSTTQGTIVKADKTKVITTDAGTWLPLVFETGYTKDNTTVTVDGQNVTAYVTNVTTEGTIAKLPLVAEPGTVTLTSGGKTQTITIGTAPTSGSAVYTGVGYLPEYYLGHTPLAPWDYYLTNYDDEGNARVLPKQTTFSTTPAKNEHPSYSPVTKLNEGNTSGNVVIMFNYENSAAKDGDKAWFDNIADNGALELVQYDQYKTVLNNHLTYTKDRTNHGGGTVGTLTIPFNQDNFRNNGRYYVRVASTTADGKKSYALVPIHVVNHDAPEFAVKETPESGRNLHFSVQNMVYAIVDPVEEVTLTKPDKTTLTLNKIDDYFLFSQDLFVLYNDTTNHLDQKGTYVLTIKANGFQDATCKFYVADGKEVETPVTKAMRSYGIDVISGASTNIGGSDSSSSGGGYAVSADLLFDSDLLANALVLEKVGAETSAASTVLDYWKTSVIADSVFNTGDTKYYTFSNYISEVNKAQTKGTMWLSFASYRTDAQATASQPRATKAVLEDGLLGDLQDSSISGKLDFVKAVVSNNQQGKEVVLTFSGNDATAYLTKIKEDGLVYLNGDWRELGTDKYNVNLTYKTITFDANCFTIGKNTIRLKAAGYKVQDVEVNYTKVNETGLSLDATVDTETAGKVHIVINGSNGDFLKNLNAITLDDRNVWLKGVSSADDVYYVVAEDYKSVDLYNVTTPGQYTVNIKANYYEEAGLSKEFTVAGTVALKPVPNAKPTVSLSDTIYKLNFGSERATKDWQDKVTSVTVNGNEYTKCGTYGPLTSNGYKLGDITGYSSVELWIEGSAFTAVNKLVIQADGYETLTLKINKNGSLVTDGEVTPPATVTVPTEAPSITKEGSFLSYYKLQFSDTAKAWLEKVNGITVNTKQYTKTTGSASSSYYSIDVDNAVINLGDTFRDGLKNTVVISADGCVDLKLKIESTDAGLTATIVNDNGSTETKNVPQYTWSSYSLKFEPSDDVADYLDAVTEVKIGSKELRATTGDWAFSGYYAVNVKSNDCTIYFSSSDFSSEEAVVSIKAEGYADLTFKVKDGQLVTDNNSGENPGTSGVTVPTEKPTIEKNSSGYHILTFTGSETWVGQISGIKVGTTVYGEETSINNLNTEGFFVKDATQGKVYIRFPSNTFGNSDVDYNVVIAAGSNVDNLKLKVTIPSGFFGTPTVEIVND
ncbi:MAG: S-layer homology domain-containing protein, partial [Evtepia sp.]|nr:S-layer homology domain-containing protein [Evtepia sp.]